MPDSLLLRVTLAQQTLAWEDPATNLNHFSEALNGLAHQTDVVILPEMFTTGFSMDAEKLAEPMEGKTMSWMAKMAAELNAAVTGSFICKAAGHFYNRLIWMCPDGSFQHYDKRHLFAYAGEHKIYDRGEQRLIVEYKGWRICPMICYDLRFPVWARYIPEQPYDLLIYTANWPEKRRTHWQQLLMARAIENQAFVIGVNRVGEDGKGFVYAGDSAVIDPLGEPLYRVAHQTVTHTSTIDLVQVNTVRDRFRFLDDGDTFSL